jgi:diguanylate cyclase (GGDEF)-like protein/PAS domain S-box-containing protein
LNDPTPLPRDTRLLLDRMLMALLIGATGWMFRSLTLVPGEIAAVWVSNGIFVGWLLSRPSNVWAGHVAAGVAADFVARWLSGSGVFAGAALGAFDLIEVMIVAGTVRRLVPDVGNPRQWLVLGGIATTTTLVACAVSGVLAAAVVAATTSAAFLPTFVTWYSAHVVGMVIVATFTLVAHREGIGVIDVPGRRWHFAGTMLLLALVSAAVFLQSAYPLLFLAYPPLLFLAYPPLLWAVFQYRFAGVVVGVSVLTVIGSVATALGHGPLSLVENASDTERIVLLQLFIGTACLMTFPVALAMAERARMMSRLRASELRYRMLADYSHDVVVRMRADGQRLYVSPSAKDILGWEPGEMIGTRWDLVHPDDRAKQRQVMREVIASGNPDTSIYRVRHKDGHYVWIEAVTRPIPSADREGVMDIIYSGRNVSRRIAAEQALQASQRELEAMARVDSLTGLANRRQFDERLALTRSQRRRQAIALMYMDIDHFKQVNDRHGHAAGDVVLRVFGQRLAACVRRGDLAARLGGDEFVVLVEDAVTPADAEAIARKLIETMAEGIVFDRTPLHVTTSIGIAFCPDASAAQALTSAADAALYAAKEAGRNTWRLVVVDDAVA